MSNYRKFKKHLKKRNLFYAIWRGIKYLVFIAKWRKGIFQDLPLNRIAKGRLRASCSSCGINIFWKGKELTTSPGLNIAVNTLGIWTDSSKAQWKILSQQTNFLKIKVIYKELPLTQIWFVGINSQNEIEWRVQSNVEEWMHIDEIRVLTTVHPYYKVWISDYCYGDFPRLDNYWHDIYLKNQPMSLVGVRFSRGDNFLPSLVIENRKDGLLPLIQNSPLSSHAHIVGARITNLNDTNNFEPGEYFILNSKVNIYEDEGVLDEKIETIRQNYLKNCIGKNKFE